MPKLKKMKKGHEVAAPGGGSEPCDGCGLCGFEVGDIVEEVITRQFEVKTIGSYYGDPLYCSGPDDVGTPGIHLRLVKKGKGLVK